MSVLCIDKAALIRKINTLIDHVTQLRERIQNLEKTLPDLKTKLMTAKERASQSKIMYEKVMPTLQRNYDTGHISKEYYHQDSRKWYRHYIDKPKQHVQKINETYRETKQSLNTQKNTLSQKQSELNEFKIALKILPQYRVATHTQSLNDTHHRIRGLLAWLNKSEHTNEHEHATSTLSEDITTLEKGIKQMIAALDEVYASCKKD